uniref:Carboxypeptidase n=1 Tax=Caenorhabditis japonica TaxID=281687 RepID=A0A8R1HG06_CAEJA
MNILTIFLLVLAGTFPSLVLSAFVNDKVTDLPGLTFQPNFDHYSGFLRAANDKNFHYWLTESSRDAAKDPLVLWLNGGPGCSSLDGLIEELGPFHVKDYGQSVYYNENTWNKFSNVLFLESPAGVGFSYSTSLNLTVSDDEVSLNNYMALLAFLTKFPEYQGRDFWITGESYAGVYIPTLAVRILGDKTNFPNFKGVAIGNGALDFPNNYNTMLPLFYYHALIRDDLYKDISQNCCNNNIGTCDVYGKFFDPNCRDKVINALGAANELNMYNLYDVCYYSPSASHKKAFIERQMRKAVGLPQRNENSATKAPLCAQTNNTFAYLNRADVRKSLHIPSSLPIWQECSDDVANHYIVTHFNVTAEFKQMIAAGIKILIYNGDVDTACNSIMNQQFLTALNLPVLGEKEKVNEPWHYSGQTGTAVAGFQTRFAENVDFLTLRGSGHFVPEDKPRESQQMIYNFINNLDYSTPMK